MEQALLRIFSKDGKQTVGIGFLVDPHHVVTCAHVVTMALNLPSTTAILPSSQSIIMDFPLLDAHQRKQRFTGHVAAWRAYQDKPGYAGDIACIQLDTPTPPDAQFAQIKVKTSLWKQNFRAYGVPSGYAQGVWAEGEILGRQSNGYFQVETIRAGGYSIQPGFSGGPVWSDQMQSVVAMLALAETTPGVRAAFAIPARILMEVLNEVQPGMQQATGAIAQLSEVAQIEAGRLPQIAQQTYTTAQYSNADSEDLLSAALIQMWIRRYDLATALLERLTQQDPTHIYAYYALALCQLEGKRAELLQNFNRAREINDLLSRATSSNAPAHIHLLFYYIRQAYFKRNGFTAFAGDLNAYAGIIRSANIHGGELDALARLLPEIANLDLWRGLRSRG